MNAAPLPLPSARPSTSEEEDDDDDGGNNIDDIGPGLCDVIELSSRDRAKGIEHVSELLFNTSITRNISFFQVRREIHEYLEREGVTMDKIDARALTWGNPNERAIWSGLHEAAYLGHANAIEVIAE